MRVYEARVTGAEAKRFTLEMPKPLRQGQTLSSGRGGEYKVAYIVEGKKRPVAILVRTKKPRGRPPKKRG